LGNKYNTINVLKEIKMTDQQIKMLLKLTGEEAKILLDQDEYSLYRDIQEQLVGLVREYRVRLPLNCLHFLYYENRNTKAASRELNTESSF
jgi:hypothetical protein